MNMNKISISQVLSEGSFAGNFFVSFDGMIPARSGSRLLVQEHALSSARDIFVAQPVKSIQQRNLLGNIEDRQVSCIYTVSIGLAFLQQVL